MRSLQIRGRGNATGLLPYNSDLPFMGAPLLTLGSDLKTKCDLKTAVSSRL